MNKPHGPNVPQVEVSDGAAAMRKMEEFTRRILAVPKKKIDEMLSKEKMKRRHR